MRQGTVTEAEQLKIFKGLVSQQGSGNSHCADCNAKSPTWCSLDLGVFVCLDCSGGHRRLGPTVSRIRSYMIDAWKYSDIEVFAATGNARVNEYYEAKLTGKRNVKPTPDATVEEKAAFIHSKYLDKEYVQDTSQLSPSQVFFRQANKINPNNRTKDNAGFMTSSNSNQSENRVQNTTTNNNIKNKEQYSNQVKKIHVPQTVSDVWDMSAFMSKGTSNLSNVNTKRSEKQGFNSVNNDQSKSKSTQPNPFDENFMNSFKSVDNNPFVASSQWCNNNNKQVKNNTIANRQSFQVAASSTQQEQENNRNSNSKLSLNSNQININAQNQQTKDKSSQKSWEKQFAEFGTFPQASSKQTSSSLQNTQAADAFDGFFQQSQLPAQQNQQEILQQQSLAQQQIGQENLYQQQQQQLETSQQQYFQQQQQFYSYSQQQQQFSQEVNLNQQLRSPLLQPQPFPQQQGQQQINSSAANTQQSTYSYSVQFQGSSGGAVVPQSWQVQQSYSQPCSSNPWDNNNNPAVSAQLPASQILQPSASFQQQPKQQQQQQPYASSQYQQFPNQMWSSSSSNQPSWDASQQYQSSINSPQYQQQSWQQQSQQQQQFQFSSNSQQTWSSQLNQQQPPSSILSQQQQGIQTGQYTNNPHININNNTLQAGSTTTVNLLDLF